MECRQWGFAGSRRLVPRPTHIERQLGFLHPGPWMPLQSPGSFRQHALTSLPLCMAYRVSKMLSRQSTSPYSDCERHSI